MSVLNGKEEDSSTGAILRLSMSVTSDSEVKGTAKSIIVVMLHKYCTPLHACSFTNLRLLAAKRKDDWQSAKKQVDGHRNSHFRLAYRHQLRTFFIYFGIAFLQTTIISIHLINFNHAPRVRVTLS